MIATDDPRIQEHARSFGADVVMTKPTCATGTDRIAEAIAKREDLQKASMIVNVQGDEPCIDPLTISKIVALLAASPSDSISTAVARIISEQDVINPNVVKCVKTPNGRALYFSRHPIPGSKGPIRMDAIQYFRHIGVYAFRPEFVMQFAALSPTPLQLTEDLEMLRAMEHGYTIAVTEIENHYPDVNVPSDIEEVKRWIENQPLYS